MGKMIFLKRLLKYKSGSIGLLIVIILVGTALLAPLIAPHDPFQQSLKKRLTPPSWMSGGDSEYVLGTDLIGGDILSRIIYGARVSLMVGGCTVVLAGCFGVLIGLLGGYYGGKIDYWVITLINMMWSFPFILLALVIVAVLGTSLVNVITALTATSWVSFARIIRGEVMAIKVREFVQAERLLAPEMFDHVPADPSKRLELHIRSRHDRVRAGHHPGIVHEFFGRRRASDRSLLGRHAGRRQGFHAGHVVACRFSGACHFLFRPGGQSDGGWVA